jgi:hypothetical protein
VTLGYSHNDTTHSTPLVVRMTAVQRDRTAAQNTSLRLHAGASCYSAALQQRQCISAVVHANSSARQGVHCNSAKRTVMGQPPLRSDCRRAAECR